MKVFLFGQLRTVVWSTRWCTSSFAIISIQPKSKVLQLTSHAWNTNHLNNSDLSDNSISRNFRTKRSTKWKYFVVQLWHCLCTKFHLLLTHQAKANRWSFFQEWCPSVRKTTTRCIGSGESLNSQDLFTLSWLKFLFNTSPNNYHLSLCNE